MTDYCAVYSQIDNGNWIKITEHIFPCLFINVTGTFDTEIIDRLNQGSLWKRRVDWDGTIPISAYAV